MDNGRPRPSDTQVPDFDSPDIVAAIRYVYLHLADPVASPDSPGALGMLRWARSSPDRFYQMLASKLSHLDADVDDHTPSKQDRVDPERIHEILGGILESTMQQKSGVVVDCPECENRFEPCVRDVSE